jgi:hypothetical protein
MAERKQLFAISGMEQCLLVKLSACIDLIYQKRTARTIVFLFQLFQARRRRFTTHGIPKRPLFALFRQA